MPKLSNELHLLFLKMIHWWCLDKAQNEFKSCLLLLQNKSLFNIDYQKNINLNMISHSNNVSSLNFKFSFIFSLWSASCTPFDFGRHFKNEISTFPASGKIWLLWLQRQSMYLSEGKTKGPLFRYCQDNVKMHYF